MFNRCTKAKGIIANGTSKLLLLLTFKPAKNLFPLRAKAKKSPSIFPIWEMMCQNEKGGRGGRCHFIQNQPNLIKKNNDTHNSDSFTKNSTDK